MVKMPDRIRDAAMAYCWSLTSVKATLNFMTTRGGVMRPAGEARRRQELLLETEAGGRFSANTTGQKIGKFASCDRRDRATRGCTLRYHVSRDPDHRFKQYRTRY